MQIGETLKIAFFDFFLIMVDEPVVLQTSYSLLQVLRVTVYLHYRKIRGYAKYLKQTVTVLIRNIYINIIYINTRHFLYIYTSGSSAMIFQIDQRRDF